MNELRLNPVKTQILFVSLDQAVASGHVLVLDGIALPWKDNIQSRRVILAPALLLDKEVSPMAGVPSTSFNWCANSDPSWKRRNRLYVYTCSIDIKVQLF